MSWKMINSKSNVIGRWSIVLAIVCGTLMPTAATSYAQAIPSSRPAADSKADKKSEAPATTAPAPPETKNADKAAGAKEDDAAKKSAPAAPQTSGTVKRSSENEPCFDSRTRCRRECGSGGRRHQSKCDQGSRCG